MPEYPSKPLDTAYGMGLVRLGANRRWCSVSMVLAETQHKECDIGLVDIDLADIGFEFDIGWFRRYFWLLLERRPYLQENVSPQIVERKKKRSDEKRERGGEE